MSNKFKSLDDLKKEVSKKDGSISNHKLVCGMNKNHKKEIFDEHFSPSGLQRFLLKVKKYKEFKECTTLSEQFIFALIDELKLTNSDLQFKILFQYGTEKQLKRKDGTKKDHFSLFVFGACIRKHKEATKAITPAQKLKANKEDQTPKVETKQSIKDIVSKARSFKSVEAVILDNIALQSFAILAENHKKEKFSLKSLKEEALIAIDQEAKQLQLN